MQEKLGPLHELDEFKKPYPLISSERVTWERIIRGSVKGNFNPAQIFYDELLSKHLQTHGFIKPLMIPEIRISDIINIDVDEFATQQVDFYLPQACLIIEIDGSQHDQQQFRDRDRDQFTRRYLIETVRIKVADLKAENAEFQKKIGQIKRRIDDFMASILSQNLQNSAPACGGRMKVVAAVTDPCSIRRYLEGVGLPARAPPLAPARPPPQHEFDLQLAASRT